MQFGCTAALMITENSKLFVRLPGFQTYNSLRRVKGLAAQKERSPCQGNRHATAKKKKKTQFSITLVNTCDKLLDLAFFTKDQRG
jgi:hypothetical protein